MSPFLLAPARLRRPALVLAALALTASAGAAQAVPGDACAGAVVRPAADSVAHTVALRVVALDPTQGVPVTLTRLVAEGVAQYLVRPASVAMLAARVMPGERGAPATAAATLAGEYLATLARGGRLGGARVLSTSLDPTFDGAILAAIDSIAADGYLFEPPMTMRGDSALLRLQVVRAEDATPGDRAPVAILHTRVPRHVVSDSAGAAVGDAVPAARRDGAPLATFVVDTAGAPLPSTVRVPGFDDATALRTLRDELPRLRYHPARVAGCRVPTFVTRPLAPGDSSVLHTADGRRVYRERQVEHPVALRMMLPPRFPEELKRRSFEGEVLIQFVVDTSGRAIPGTLRALRADHPLFLAAVRTSVEAARFAPATIGGRPVAQLVQQPFQFTLTRDTGVADLVPGGRPGRTPRPPFPPRP
jgi:TonB family protein